MPTLSPYIVAAVLAGICLFGCRSQSSGPTAAAKPSDGIDQSDSKDADYLHVAEAVFRHQFDHNASGAQRDVDYFFIALEKGDPPPELLARLADVKPRVLPASLATLGSEGSEGSEGVRHKELDGIGLIFDIRTIKWLDADTAEVDGGYYEADHSSSGNVYHVERRAGKWIVTNDKMKWIS